MAENLTKTFAADGMENAVLRGVSLEIGKGEFVCIVGRSGSGKSTLLNTLSTLLHPDSGSIYFRGEEITNLGEARLNSLRHREFSMVFQFHHLMPYLTVLENVLLPYMNSLKSVTQEQSLRAKDCLKRVGLEEKLKSLPGRLSGGEQQRVAIARALVRLPSVLFADEPTGNLDRKTGQSIMELLRELNREGLTVVMVTHELAYTHYADRILEIEDGAIQLADAAAAEAAAGLGCPPDAPASAPAAADPAVIDQSH